MIATRGTPQNELTDAVQHSLPTPTDAVHHSLSTPTREPVTDQTDQYIHVSSGESVTDQTRNNIPTRKSVTNVQHTHQNLHSETSATDDKMTTDQYCHSTPTGESTNIEWWQLADNLKVLLGAVIGKFLKIISSHYHDKYESKFIVLFINHEYL